MGDRYADELGELSYEETLEAVKILLQEKLTPQEEASILLYFIHSFNDKYNRNEIVSVPIEDDNLFKNIYTEYFKFQIAGKIVMSYC